MYLTLFQLQDRKVMNSDAFQAQELFPVNPVKITITAGDGVSAGT
jgi:hypothetical protein